MDLLERINRHLRQLAPHQTERAGMMMLAEARDEIIKLQKLATCECGDEFTDHDPGTCVNCLMTHNVKLTGGLTAESERTDE